MEYTLFCLTPRLEKWLVEYIRQLPIREDNLSFDKRVLIIDQLNLFFRNYIVNPSVSTDGMPIGGLRGCIQSLQKVVRESKPDMIVICWDGQGGSKKRKLLKKDYKAGRKPIRLNRSIRNLSEEQEVDNKIWQQTRLIEYYNQIPVIQFMFDSTEADDIIAYVANHKCLNKRSIVEKFNIHPTNFAMARAMAGDKSDNIDGIPGLGLKTISKRFPFLREEKTATFSDIISRCKKELEEKEIKAFRNILESENILRRNYQMMQLYAPLLSIGAKNIINETFKDPDNTFNKTELIKMMIKDGFGEINFIELFQHLNKISLDKG